MLNFYIVMGLLGGIMVAISIAGYRIEKGKLSAKSELSAKEEREKIQSSTDDLKKNILTGEEKIIDKIESGVSDLANSQELNSEILKKEVEINRDEIKKDRERKSQNDAARFYVQMKLIPFDLENPSFTIEYLFHNYGNNYAKDFNAQLHIIPSDYSFNNMVIISSATEIAPKLSLQNTGKIGDYTIVKNQIPVFFYIDLNFYDEILGKKINQEFYFKWMGIQNGNYSNTIEVAQRGDIKNLKKYIEDKIKI